MERIPWVRAPVSGLPCSSFPRWEGAAAAAGEDSPGEVAAAEVSAASEAEVLGVEEPAEAGEVVNW